MANPILINQIQHVERDAQHSSDPSCTHFCWVSRVSPKTEQTQNQMISAPKVNAWPMISFLSEDLRMIFTEKSTNLFLSVTMESYQMQ